MRLLVRGCAGGSEVVLDFPVSRRVHPETKSLPGMVPLVLQAAPATLSPISAGTSIGRPERCTIIDFQYTRSATTAESGRAGRARTG